jgi:hypothetical protein
MVETRKRSIILSEKQLAFLEKEAALFGITVSDLIRRIIDERRPRIVADTHFYWPKRADGTNMEMGEWNDKYIGKQK